MTNIPHLLTIITFLPLVGAVFKAFNFWHGMGVDFDPAATWPLILGVGLSLVLGGIVVGVFLYGRRKEIKGEE